MQKKAHYLLFALTVLVIAALAVALSFFSPQEFVERVGVRNGFAIVFFVSLFGSVSFLTTASFYATILAFAAGGLDPLLLGIIGGLGATIGDILFFALGHLGRKVASQRISQKLDRFSMWLNKKPAWIVFVVIFVYVGLTPLPNDFLMLALALIHYPLKKALLPLLLANITLISVLAFLAQNV